MQDTYSYERGEDMKYRITHRSNGEVVAVISPDSCESDLELALKNWILSPDLKTTVQGWIKAQRRPKAKPKSKASGTRGGRVTVRPLDD